MKLKEIAKVQGGFAFKSDSFVSNETPIIRIGNIINNEIIIDKDITAPISTIGDRKEFLIFKDDLLIAMSGATVGKVGIYNFDSPSMLNQRVGNIKSDEMYKKYIFYLLQSPKFKKYVELSSIGCAQPNISNSQIENFEFKENSIDQIEKIVRKLDSVKSLINIKKNEIEKCKELVKSQFVEMFKNCDKVRLSEIANITMGQSPSSESYNDIGNGLPFFQGKADYGDKYTIVKHWTNKPSKLSYKGDVLMSVRAPVGPVNISSCDCCIGRGLCSISSKDGLTNNEFLFNALNTIQDEIASKGTGSTFKAITKNDVYNIELPLGTLELQNKFAQIVEQIDKQKFVNLKIFQLLGKKLKK